MLAIATITRAGITATLVGHVLDEQDGLIKVEGTVVHVTNGQTEIEPDQAAVWTVLTEDVEVLE